ncbi:MAG TPA: DUF58 domain-containing protein [Myxococcota bacterium]
MTQADEELRALLKRVRQIELQTRKAVNAAGQGAYHSRFKGRGMAFSESRAYVPGDDPRHIDWNATARRHDPQVGHTGSELFVKQFVEERELTVLLAVDLSGSMSTGSRARTKRQIAAEAAALLAFSALRNNDKVGLVAFTDRIELLVRPKKGRGHVLRLLREILAAKPVGTGTALASAVETVTHLSKQRAIVALVSDMLVSADGFAKLERPLKVLARRHDLIVIEVADPLEGALPSAGLVSVEDPESKKRILVDSGDKKVREAYQRRTAGEREKMRGALAKLGVDRVAVTDQESSQALVRFLRRRARKAA